MKKVELIVILPVHNEAKFLIKAVNEVVSCAEKLAQNYLIVIAEDGSVDGSDKLAFELEKSIRNVKVIHNSLKLGRGKALRNALLPFEAFVYAYIDVDLATDMKFFPVLVKSIRMGYDIATGSRYIRGAVVKRPLLRGIVSKLYNWIVRNLFKTGIFDHQCGFKAFNRKFRDEILNKCICNDWFWDAEVLILGRREGYRIYEFPVYWVERRTNKTRVRRLINDIRVHSIELLKVLKNYKKLRRGNKEISLPFEPTIPVKDRYKSTLNRRLSKHGSQYKIVDKVGHEKRVLDVGCATGYISKILRTEKSCYVVGLEIDHDAAEIAKTVLNHVIEADIEEIKSLPYPEKYFDVILCGDILEHLKRPDLALKKLKPYLAPQGVLIAVIPNVVYLPVRVRVALGRFDYTETGILDKTHLRFFTLSTSKQLIISAGYRILSIEYTGIASLLPILPTVFAMKFIIMAQPN